MAAKLIVTRKAAWFNRRQRYKIWVNDKEIGSVKNDDTEEFQLEPGTYKVKCTLNWMSSAEYTVSLQEGINTYIQVSNGMKWIGPLYILMIAGLLLPFYYKITKTPMPESVDLIKLAMVLPALFYIIAYTTFLRKRYFIIDTDNNNPFK